MLIDTKPNDFQAHGIMKARKSSIKLSAKTFKMHIDAQYSKKIEAPVRELASNAWDSHLRAGTTKAFYVQAPTVLMPEFAVRDYGVGMTDDVMENVYIVLGESDKDTSNSEVGMWGHGAMSPYAYTDQYTISCYDGETVRHYGYGLAEDDIPTLYLMSEEPCEEPRGVRVAFAVESRDFQAFEKAIKEIAVAHNGAFETNVALPDKTEPAFAGADWHAVEDGPLDAGWYARQGCVIYPIDGRQVPVPSSYQNQTYRFIIDCPIGTVKVTPSREMIEYSEEVIAYLRNRVELVKDEIQSAIWNKVQHIKSVGAFFVAAKKLTPPFITASYTHPVTGLTAAQLKRADEKQFFHCERKADGRWEFAVPDTVSLVKGEKPWASAFLILPEGSAFFDTARDTRLTSALSQSEQRRVGRFVRAYMQKHDIVDATLLMNFADETVEFWEACFGENQFSLITFDDLRDSLARRVTPTPDKSKPPIRGLAFAKAAGDQKPVFEIAPQDETHAWISSAQHRRQAGPLFKLAKSHGINALYIAAPQAQHLMDENSIPHLKDAIDAKLKERGSSFAEWYYIKDVLQSQVAKSMITFLAALDDSAYARIVGGKGTYSTIARYAKPYLNISELAGRDEDKKVLEALVADNDDRVHPPVYPKDSRALRKALDSIAGYTFYSNPASGIVTSLAQFIEPEQANKMIGLLLHLQNAFPPKDA